MVGTGGGVTAGAGAAALGPLVGGATAVEFALADEGVIVVGAAVCVECEAVVGAVVIDVVAVVAVVGAWLGGDAAGVLVDGGMEVVDVVVVVVDVDVVVEVDVEVDVEVVVVLVVGGALGSGGPSIRGVPMNSKCMPSVIGKLPPQAKPFRRNTSTIRGSIVIGPP